MSRYRDGMKSKFGGGMTGNSPHTLVVMMMVVLVMGRMIRRCSPPTSPSVAGTVGPWRRFGPKKLGVEWATTRGTHFHSLGPELEFQTTHLYDVLLLVACLIYGERGALIS